MTVFLLFQNTALSIYFLFIEIHHESKYKKNAGTLKMILKYLVS